MSSEASPDEPCVHQSGSPVGGASSPTQSRPQPPRVVSPGRKKGTFDQRFGPVYPQREKKINPRQVDASGSIDLFDISSFSGGSNEGLSNDFDKVRKVSTWKVESKAGAVNFDESAEFSDLKGLIKTTLGRQGVLNVFKSQMRRCVLHAIRIADDLDSPIEATASIEALEEWNQLETLTKLVENAMRPPFGSSTPGISFFQTDEGKQSILLFSAFLNFYSLPNTRETLMKEVGLSSNHAPPLPVDVPLYLSASESLDKELQAEGSSNPVHSRESSIDGSISKEYDESDWEEDEHFSGEETPPKSNFEGGHEEPCALGLDSPNPVTLDNMRDSEETSVHFSNVLDHGFHEGDDSQTGIIYSDNHTARSVGAEIEFDQSSCEEYEDLSGIFIHSANLSCTLEDSDESSEEKELEDLKREQRRLEKVKHRASSKKHLVDEPAQAFLSPNSKTTVTSGQDLTPRLLRQLQYQQKQQQEQLQAQFQLLQQLQQQQQDQSRELLRTVQAVATNSPMNPIQNTSSSTPPYELRRPVTPQTQTPPRNLSLPRKLQMSSPLVPHSHDKSISTQRISPSPHKQLRNLPPLHPSSSSSPSHPFSPQRPSSAPFSPQLRVLASTLTKSSLPSLTPSPDSAMRPNSSASTSMLSSVSRINKMPLDSLTSPEGWGLHSPPVAPLPLSSSGQKGTEEASQQVRSNVAVPIKKTPTPSKASKAQMSQEFDTPSTGPNSWKELTVGSARRFRTPLVESAEEADKELQDHNESKSSSAYYSDSFCESDVEVDPRSETESKKNGVYPQSMLAPSSRVFHAKLPQNMVPPRNPSSRNVADTFDQQEVGMELLDQSLDSAMNSSRDSISKSLFLEASNSDGDQDAETEFYRLREIDRRLGQLTASSAPVS